VETDLSLSKNFKVTERINFDIRMDARNLFNIVNFAAPSAVLPAALDVTPTNPFGSSIFGRINADVTNNARRIQLSAKINF